MPPEPLQLPDLGFPSNDESEIDSLGEPDLSLESASSPYLKNIPEQDRPIVSKYIKGWDGDVTRRFQKIHDEVRPWKELGEIDVIKRQIEIVRLLQADPKTFHKNLTEFIKQLDGEDMNDEIEEDDVPVKEDSDPRDSMIADLQKKVDELSGAFTEDFNSRYEQQEIAKLDKELDRLHTVHGDFDEDWVLVQVSRGTPIESAIKQFNDKYGNSRVNSFRKDTPPKILSGAGSVGQSQVDTSKMSKSDKLNYMTQLLEGASSSSNS
jgi:hypothetical protein